MHCCSVPKRTTPGSAGTLITVASMTLTIQQIQRFQMRFTNNVDYYTALGHFSAVDAPLTEAGSILPPLRPVSVSSSSSFLKPRDSASNIGAQRPFTANDPLDQGRGISSGQMARSEVSTIAHRIASSDMQRMECSLDQPASAITDDIPLKSPAKMRDLSPPVVSVKNGLGLAKAFGISKPVEDGTIISKGPIKSSEARTTTLATSNALKKTTDSLVPTTLSDYHPRPSTAPAIESQSLRDMLPPPRTLPFPKSSSEIGLKALSKQKSTAKPVSQSASSMPGTSSFRVEFANSQKPETQSVPPSNPRAKKATAKKPAIRTSRKPAAPKSKKSPTVQSAQSPVPSVEDLLSRSREPAQQATPGAGDIDTQALLAQVEERQAFKSASTSPKKRGLPAEFGDGDPWIPPSAQRSAPNVFQSPSDRTPENLTQMQQTEQRFIAASATHAEISAARRTLHRAASEDLTTPAISARRDPGRVATLPTEPQPSNLQQENERHGLFDSGAIPIPLTPVSLTAMRAPLTERSLNAPIYSTLSAPGMSTSQPISQDTASATKLVRPLEALLQDENFAKAPDLAQWARQSDDDRHATLETFLCNNIDNPDFFILCKDLGGMWESRFLGKKI